MRAMLPIGGVALLLGSFVASAGPETVGTRRMTTIGEQRLYFQDMGDAAAPTLVLLHGAGGVQSTGEVGPLLAERYHVLIPSLPGFDESPRGSVQTLADAVEVIGKFIRQNSTTPVYVVGQSLGGRTASWLGILHPELVRKLVLSAPATLAARAPQLPDDDLAARKMLAKMLFGSEAAIEKISPSQLVSQRAAIALLTQYMQAPSRDTFLARLQEIAAPTLILWGKDDTVLKPDEGPPLFKARIRNLRVQVIDGPHALPIANPRDYVRYTLEFLAAP